MTTERVRGRATRILVINPNSSQAMTNGIKKVIDEVDLPYSVEVFAYTAPPNAPLSINDDEGIRASFTAVSSHFTDSDNYDGILVACFSVHPLVSALQSSLSLGSTVVTGVFEAGVVAALSLISPGCKWGIVTTGAFWEEHLTAGVQRFLGISVTSEANTKFAGVESTGLNASDFHDGVDHAVVEDKLRQATRRLLSRSDVTCIVMGCAGMAGLEDIIRGAASEVRGQHFAYNQLYIVDGVRAGIMQLENAIKQQRLLRSR
ncbi:Asp/Glu/hydantoin racemase [Durotheca rogersii]|uniref:Asp/Glu/hydantoin racemase n=1 Tax=Durotheca rogersii TaxID=419775 RepID=UPI00221F4DDE|nr:Asp/Glu/hydantoin racemase [Durotheca rogersii]KAI5856191.1 Asp/Glu/hydantoin racemase [Durotheca rogersii]